MDSRFRGNDEASTNPTFLKRIRRPSCAISNGQFLGARLFNDRIDVSLPKAEFGIAEHL
jgi:hypothetical protein